MRAPMRRIAIVGCSGGGKSTLARALGARLALPVVHLDSLFWKPDWRESPLEEFRPRVEDWARREEWIIEGNFILASTLRFQRADTIIWLELPIWLCLMRAVIRSALAFGRARADLAPGCPERFDLAFYGYIWSWNRLTRPKMAQALAVHAPGARLIRLAGDRQAAAFLSGLPAR